ncbi:MAG: hypothetical protein K9N07_08170 [Candidatus Cloacimonetes bacterium]|nr:hypothetical protein [Candidatus Cloacimonadota bacterium]
MIAIYVDRNLKKFEDKIKFTFDFIFNTLGYEYNYVHSLDQIKRNDIIFFYSLIEPTIKEAYILALNKILFYIPVFPELLQSGKMTKKDVEKFTNIIKLIKKIPVLNKKEIKVPFQYHQNSDLYYGIYKFDLIGNIFFNLHTSNTIDGVKRDELGWITDDDVPFFGFHQEPYVNILLWLLENCILDSLKHNGRTFLVKKAYWPSAEVFANSFSYNIDKLQKWTLKSMVTSSLEDALIFYKFKYVFNNFISKIKYLLTNIEEYWNFEIITQIENLHQVVGTFFFGTGSEEKNDIDYSIENKEVHKELMEYKVRGDEIALLASVNAGKKDILHKQKKKLLLITSEESLGVRHNHCNYDPKLSYEYHRKNGFIYNSSFGFHNKNGFKHGFGFPYYQMGYHNEDTVRNFSWHSLELPVNFFDEHLKLSRSSIIPFETAKDIVDQLIDSIEVVNGLVTWNFSNSNFDEIKYNKELLNYIIEQIRPKKVFIATLMQIAQWWRKRETIEIFESEERFYIYFPSKTDKFSITIFGNFEIDKVNYAEAEISENNIYFSNVKLDSKIEVSLRRKENSEDVV